MCAKSPVAAFQMLGFTAFLFYIIANSIFLKFVCMVRKNKQFTDQMNN